MRLLAAFMAMLLCGCAGYTVGPIKPTPMKSVRRIAVRNWKNDTLEPRVESMIATMIIKQIQQDGTFEVTDEARADAVLDGTLLSIDRRPVRSLRGNILQTREYQLTLRGRYSVTEKATGKILDQRNLIGVTSFFVTGQNLLAADSNQDERQALPYAIEEMATRLTSTISEGW
ncbi:MAG: hypothetical protein RL088_3132 [Verrucomicrobiota bacterium]|jgi:hypothetical protein